MTCDAEVGCDDLPGFAGISQGKREDDAKMEAALVERCKKILEETPQATSFFREVRWDTVGETYDPTCYS